MAKDAVAKAIDGAFGQGDNYGGNITDAVRGRLRPAQSVRCKRSLLYGVTMRSDPHWGL